MMVVSVKDNQQFYIAPTTLSTPRHWENWDTAWVPIKPALANSLYVGFCSTLMTLATTIANMPLAVVSPSLLRTVVRHAASTTSAV